MIDKIRIEITHVYEYEPEMEDYGTEDIAEALQIDLANAKDSPAEFMEFGRFVDVKVTGRVVTR